MHQLNDDELNAETSHILAIVRDASPEIAVMAVVIGGRLVPLQEATPFSEALLTSSQAVDKGALKPASLISLLTTQARLHFLTRNIRDCRRLLNDAFHTAQSNGIRSGAYLFLLNGMAVLQTVDGNYEEALALTIQLHSEATRIGHELRAASATANAAVMSLRLGRYQETIMWAQRAGQYQLSHSERVWMSKWPHGLAAALLGDVPLARKVAEELVQIGHQAMTLAPQQFAYTSAADIFYLAGEREKAIETAKMAVAQWPPTAGNLEISGRLARWRALTVPTSGGSECSEELRWILRNQIDLIDRAEVLSALVHLRMASCSEMEELKSTLNRLPLAIRDQLHHLGMLTTLRSDKRRWPMNRCLPLKTNGNSGVTATQKEAAVRP
jgi:tetratricopeptide (TPR) repeat protein